jgi:hypothetical protein
MQGFARGLAIVLAATAVATLSGCGGSAYVAPRTDAAVNRRLFPESSGGCTTSGKAFVATVTDQVNVYGTGSGYPRLARSQVALPYGFAVDPVANTVYVAQYENGPQFLPYGDVLAFHGSDCGATPSVVFSANVTVNGVALDQSAGRLYVLEGGAFQQPAKVHVWWSGRLE